MHINSNMFDLPPVTESDSTCSLHKLSGLTTTQVEPVGRWFEAYCTRRYHKKSLSHHVLSSSSSEDDEDDIREEDKEEEKLLMTLDPKDWKHQDHYAVLGISNLRYRVTEDQIKRAYKRKVLRHHPDKRRARGIPVKEEGEEDYFTCITRAYEILGNPAKRKSFDSVDAQFDDSIPPVCAESREKFFETFRPVFERNSRWSNRTRIPEFGNDSSTFDEVNNFYAFWYEFDSWREYSYLDEEEKEKGENRDERRWIEKQNKSQRQKRKKEEILRIRQIVDNAYACDPRLARFKAVEKERKESEKRAKREAARVKVETEDRKKKAELEEATKRKAKEEEESRAQAAAAKKEKEAQKKAMKKEKKTIRMKVKEYDYFAKDDSERIKFMQELDKVTELLSLASLQSLNEDLCSGDKEKAKAAFFSQMTAVNEQMEREKMELMKSTQKPDTGSEGGGSAKRARWPEEEKQQLIKAVNLFPAGTVARWETVASYLKQHVEGSDRTAKEVLAQAKELQKKVADSSMKDEVNKKAFDHFAKDAKGASGSETSDISQRFDSVAQQQVSEMGSNPAPWGTDEQRLLEQSLRTFPASTPARWDRIAEVIPQRSKKDCMKRYKELVEMVQSKKAAQAAAVKAKKT